jgi:putative CocE/NonD family hydrolase
VRLARTGDGRWWELPEWPPPTTPHQWLLGAGGRLTDGGAESATSHPDEPSEPATALGDPAPPACAEFRYDPADPTPAVGGRLLTPDAGVRDNRRLAARPDVVTFTTPPLDRDLVIAGSARVELDHAADPPHADVFLRLCDVAPNGRAHNVADGMRRREPAVGPLAVELDPCFHRVAAGHRLALLVAGGAHPRFLRNNGTGEPPADAVGLVPVTHRVRGGTLTLPLTEDHTLFPPTG